MGSQPTGRGYAARLTDLLASPGRSGECSWPASMD
jgi:hypothetical protein